MTSQQMSFIAPLASPLPPSRKEDILTFTQWITLLAIGDAIIPSVIASPSLSTDKLALQDSDYTLFKDELQATLPAGTDATLANAYLTERISSLVSLKDLIHRTLSEYLRQDATRGLSVILSALEYRPTVISQC